MSVEQVCDAGVGQECLASLRALFARRCRDDATWLAALHEAGRAVAGRRERMCVLDEFSGDEVAAALGWSRSMSGQLLSLADDLLTRLPEVHAAMAGGALELGKARVLSEWTRELEPDHAHHVCAVVLPAAPRCHQGELITRVQAVASALDPAWAQRRLEAAQRGASVFGSMNPSGTANVVGRDLDPVAAVAAMARIDTLAERLRAALRARGVHHPVARLRATVYERLLDGHAAGVDDDAVLDILVAELAPPDPDDPGPDEPGPDDDPGPRDPGPGQPGPDDPGPADGPGDAHGPGYADGAEETGAGPVAGVDRPAPDVRRATRTGTVSVRVRLTTALGRDDTPAEVPTWGTVTAAVARTLLADRHDAEWRLVLTDADGHLEHLFLLRRRPVRTAAPGQPTAHERRGVVELQVPAAVLRGLDPDGHTAWAAVLREAQARAAEPVTLAAGHPATTRGDAARRRAGAELDRWVRTRDRACLGVMCTRSAESADLDHTRDWALGGTTVAENLGALCRHTHRLKHVGGWALEQPRPGHFRWTSRAGVVHEVRPRPVTPALPAPCPRRDRRPRTSVEEILHPERRHAPFDGHDAATWSTPGARDRHATDRHASDRHASDRRGAARPGPGDDLDIRDRDVPAPVRYPEEPPF